MNNTYVIIAALIMAVVTFIVRAMPFYCIELFKNHPYIEYISNKLPASIMLILVIFSIQDTNIISYPYGLPECISVICVATIHIYKRNTIASIVTGIVIYGILTNILGVHS